MELVLNTNIPAQIGKTGLIIDIQNLKIDLSNDKNIEEADLDERPPEFMGVYTEYTAITLPKKWFNNIDNTTLQVAGRNMLIGTGGISGIVSLEAIDGTPNNGAAYLNLNIGNWEIGFNYFDLQFKQNVITESNIVGQLKIPKLKNTSNEPALIDIKGHLNEEGDFNLTASEAQGIPLHLFNFVSFNFKTLELGKEDDKFYIGTSCEIWFDNAVMNKILNGQKIEIPRLRIYDDGSMEIVGGTGFIPTSFALNLGPIEMAVTGIHFGSTQKEFNGNMRTYNYWGFDGAISLDPLGIDARGEGVKYYYTVDNDEFGDDGDHFVRIQTIEVDLVIPGSADSDKALAIIHGMLSIPEPGVSNEYVAEVSVKLPKLKIAGGASMKLQPKHPAFIIEAGFDLSSPIPLGGTGLAFYGFGGLLGYRYVADKSAVSLEADASWYDYFTAPQRGVNVQKFIGPEEFGDNDYSNAFSIGAGTVLATQFDDGYTLSTRLMAILSLPQVFILDGRANVLGERLGMMDHKEPPFFAFVAIGQDSIELGFGADYKMPKSTGKIIDLYAEVQAGFFFNNPSAWYINFGTQDVPITATLFKGLLNLRGFAYLMLSAQGMKAGAGVSFDLNKRFGPFKIHLYAYFEVGGFISFERPQMGGYIAAGGVIDVDVWVVSLTLTLDALFSVEAPKPYLIFAEVSFRVCVRILFVKVCKSFTIKLKWEKNKTIDRTPIQPLTTARTEELVNGVHMLTNESFDLNYLGTSNPPSISQIDKIIPLDTYIEFKAEKGLDPSAISDKIGGYTFPPEKHIDLIPPKKVVRGGMQLRQVKHKYSIEAIEIKAWDGNSWEDYHPYEAVVPDGEPRQAVQDLKIGYWQIKGKQYDTLRLLATMPFNYMEAGEPGWSIPEQFGITPSTLFCSEDIIQEDCSNVLNKALGTIYYPPTQYNGELINGAYYTLINQSAYNTADNCLSGINGDFMKVTDDVNPHGLNQSLSFNNYNSMVIILPEASFSVKLLISTYAHSVTIKYFKVVIDEESSNVSYELIHEITKTASELDNEVEYAHANEAISKVEIFPTIPQTQGMKILQEDIAKLYEANYKKVSGVVSIIEPDDSDAYQSLLDRENDLKQASYSQNNEGGGQRNGTVCDTYETLLGLYDDYFVPVQTNEQVDANISYFHQFQGIIKVFVDEHNLFNHPIYTELGVFNEIYMDIKQNQGDNHQMERFHYLISSAEELLSLICNYGNCDCPINEKCITSLQQICWLTLENHEWNESIPGSEAIEEEYEGMVQGLQKIAQPIWRPNSFYYIKFRLKDEVDNGASDPGEYDYYYGFKTVGPLGHYHKNPEVDYVPSGAKADEYPLTSLRSYIDYNRSYPNADGNLLKTKPQFYGNKHCKIDVIFTKPYMYHMLSNWPSYLGVQFEGALHIAIKDPVSGVIIPYPLPPDFENDVPLTTDILWENDEDPRLPPHIQVINNMIENGDIPCDIHLGEAIAPLSYYYSAGVTNLKPRKLYTAQLYNAFEITNGTLVNETVHEFVFQTSRYESFEKQVESYKIIDEDTLEEKQAVYDISLALDEVSIDKAYQIINSPDDQIGDPLENQYQHLFDRVTEGVFGMKPVASVERTEFVKIMNLNTGNVVALLIRNPEPFNNPKIPLEDMKETIQVTFSNGNENGAYSILHSKDYSQAIIMREDGNITAEKMHFKFIYLVWNGSKNKYVVSGDPVQLTDIVINE